MLIYGINPVLEALRAGRVKELRIVARAEGRVADLVQVLDDRTERVAVCRNQHSSAGANGGRDGAFPVGEEAPNRVLERLGKGQLG